jgi:hypothetical protein
MTMRGLHARIAGAFVVGLIMTFLTCAAFASEATVGSVLAARGAVFLDTAGVQQPIVAGTPVNRGDTIVTAAGKVKIALGNGSIISVGENSRLRIVGHAATSGDVKTRVGLISGALRLFVAKVTPSGKFEVETETAIAAVRGTDWVIEATPDLTSVALVSGVVAVSARDGQSRTPVVLDSSGQGTDVRRGETPTPVVRWGAQRFATTLARATFE